MVPKWRGALLLALAAAAASCAAAQADEGFVVDASGSAAFVNLRGGHDRRLNDAIAGSALISKAGAASYAPALAALPSSKYVAVWQSSGLDFDQSGVYGQLGTAKAGAAGAAFQINTVWQNRQENPAVAALAKGVGFIAAWQSFRTDGSSWGVYGQMFDAVGNKAKKEFQISTTNADSQADPAVAGLTNGNFVAVWRSYAQDTDGAGIFAQQLSGAGAKVGGEVQINTITAGNQEAPSVAPLPDGGFVVVWQDVAKNAGASVISGRAFTGGALGKQFQVSSDATLQYNRAPAVAALDGGAFVVVWEATAPANGDAETHIYGQVYTAVNKPEGGQFKASVSNAPGPRVGAAVTGLAASSNASFVVAWTSTAAQDSDGSGVYGQVYKRAGAGKAPTNVLLEFAVSDDKVGDQARVALAGLPDGSFVAAYESESDVKMSAVRTRGFEVVTTAIGTDLCAETGAQCDASVPCCGNGQYSCGADGMCASNPEYVPPKDSSGGEGNVLFQDGKLTGAGIAVAASLSAGAAIGAGALLLLVRKRRKSATGGKVAPDAGRKTIQPPGRD